MKSQYILQLNLFTRPSLMSKSWAQTAIAVINSMVGTSLLVLPIYYEQFGIFPNIIASTIMCTVLTTLAVFIGSLVTGRERIFSNIVRTYLGRKWAKIMNTILAFEVLMVCCIIFLLSSDIFYQLLQSVSPTIHRMGPQVFKSFLVIAYLPLTLLNSLDIIVKFSWMSMILLWFYVGAMFYSFVENIPAIDQHAFDTKPGFGFADMQMCLSLQAFAFTGHTTLDAVLKENREPKRNKSAVACGFILAFVIMLICGVTGGLALYKKDRQQEGDNILHYFVGYWQFYALGSAMFAYLLSFLPILTFVSQFQAFEVLPTKFKQTQDMKDRTWKLVKVGFNIVFFILLQIFIILDTSPAKVMGFISTTVAFYFCYLLPASVKIKLSNKADALQIEGPKMDESTLITLPEETSTHLKEDPALIPKSNKGTRKIKKAIYIGLLIFGVAMFVSEIVVIFQTIIL